MIIYGMCFLSEPNGPFAICGCLIALGGGIWYAFVRRNLGLQQAKAQDAMTSSSSAASVEAGKSSSS